MNWFMGTKKYITNKQRDEEEMEQNIYKSRKKSHYDVMHYYKRHMCAYMLIKIFISEQNKI